MFLMQANNALHKLYKAAYRVPAPTTADTIYVSKQDTCVPVTTAATAFALTLARPLKDNIRCLVLLDTDGGGDLTLTVTGGYNADADTSIVFGDAGDFVQFVSIRCGTTYYWRVLSQEGTTAAGETLDVDTLSIGGTAITATAAEINTACDQSVQQMTPGAGFLGAGGFYWSSIQRIGTLYKTTIFMDLTGLASSTTDEDIIGLAAGGAAHFGQITAALNGTLFYGQVTCLETPAGGVTDIQFWSATEGTGAYNGLITDLTEVSMYNKGSAAAGAAATQIALTALPAANKYMYLAGGAAGTAAEYSAGQFLVELWGA
jgi:hypothetical protein